LSKRKVLASIENNHMDIHYLTGMVKAAKEKGLSYNEISQFLKAANVANISTEDASALGEAPDMGAGAPPSTGGSPDLNGPAGVPEASSPLDSLPPEVLEQIATELAAAQQGQPVTDPAVQQLAQAIEQHLSSPDAEKQGSYKSPELANMKQAKYIEGFLDRATKAGLNYKEAIDTYQQALDLSEEIVNNKIKTASENTSLTEQDYYILGMFEKAAELGLTEDQAASAISTIVGNK
jgi:tetratricopeptide (TPR) repeat protein